MPLTALSVDLTTQPKKEISDRSVKITRLKQKDKILKRKKYIKSCMVVHLKLIHCYVNYISMKLEKQTKPKTE